MKGHAPDLQAGTALLEFGGAIAGADGADDHTAGQGRGCAAREVADGTAKGSRRLHRESDYFPSTLAASRHMGFDEDVVGLALRSSPTEGIANVKVFISLRPIPRSNTQSVNCCFMP
jgi:hypothetical protein